MSDGLSSRIHLTSLPCSANLCLYPTLSTMTRLIPDCDISVQLCDCSGTWEQRAQVQLLAYAFQVLLSSLLLVLLTAWRQVWSEWAVFILENEGIVPGQLWWWGHWLVSDCLDHVGNSHSIPVKHLLTYTGQERNKLPAWSIQTYFFTSTLALSFVIC